MFNKQLASSNLIPTPLRTESLKSILIIFKASRVGNVKLGAQGAGHCPGWVGVHKGKKRIKKNKMKILFVEERQF